MNVLIYLNYEKISKLNQHKLLLNYTLIIIYTQQCSTSSLWIMTVEHFCQRKIPFGKTTTKKNDLSGTLRENLGGGPHSTCWGAMLISYLWMTSDKFLCGASIAVSPAQWFVSFCTVIYVAAGVISLCSHISICHIQNRHARGKQINRNCASYHTLFFPLYLLEILKATKGPALGINKCRVGNIHKCHQFIHMRDGLSRFIAFFPTQMTKCYICV